MSKKFEDNDDDDDDDEDNDDGDNHDDGDDAGDAERTFFLERKQWEVGLKKVFSFSSVIISQKTEETSEEDR